jgi:hypothetical protein
MIYKVAAVFAMFLSASLSLAFNQAFAQSGPAHHSANFAKHSPHHRFPHHDHRRSKGLFGGFWGVPDYEFGMDADAPTHPPTVYEPRYTCTYDIPWDWVHRCPPVAAYPEAPSEPVVRGPGCVRQVVTVPGADGKDQTINMVRC